MNLLPGGTWTLAPLLFLPQPRHGPLRNPYLYINAFDFQAKGLDESLGKEVMARLNSFLRSTRSRIGRRLSEIVAIAAASLPAVGA